MRKSVSLLCTVTAVVLVIVYILNSVLISRWKSGEQLRCVEVRTPEAPQLAMDPDKGSHKSYNKKGGYLLALHFYEQQTQGIKNFLQLQCLASSHNMQVVEPFLHKSQLGFPFSLLAEGKKQVLKLGKLIDMDIWNEQTAKFYNYPPVATWKDFLENAPRKVVIVCMRHHNPSHINPPEPAYNFRFGCPDSCFDRFSTSLSFLRKHGFHLVRKACANFEKCVDVIASEQFFSNILGKHKEEDVTVMVQQFRGLFGFYRTQILSACGITHTSSNTYKTMSIGQ